MPNPGVKVEFASEDHVSGAIDRINKRLALMRAPAERTQRSLARFGELSGFKRLGDGVSRVATYAKDAFFSLGRIVPVLGVITSAASIAGVVRLASAWANFGSRLGFSAQRIGVSASQLQSLDGAARMAGSSAGSLQSGMQTLGQGMWDAVGGRNPELMSAFRALHVNFQNLDGSAKSVTEVMPQLADKIAAIKDPYAQAAVAAHFFGAASEDLLPFLRLGSDGMARYNETAKRYGVTNQEGVAAANRLRMAQVELTLATEGLGNSIAQSLEPVITPIIHGMSEWIAANRVWIAGRIADYVRDLSTWVGRTWPQVQNMVSTMGGWGAVARDAAGGIGVLIAARTIAGLLGLGSALAGVAAPMAAIAIGYEALRKLEDWQDKQRQARGAPALDANGRPVTGGPAGIRPGSLLRPEQTLADSIDAASGLRGVDRNMVRALITRESGGQMVHSYDPKSSAFGYMQLTDGTARDEGVNSHDPVQNVMGGVSHFAKALRLAGGDLQGAAAAYHDGLNSTGIAWFAKHHGDMSRFTSGARAEAADVAANYRAEQAAPPGSSGYSPLTAYGRRATRDIMVAGRRLGIFKPYAGISPAETPVPSAAGSAGIVPPGSAANGNLGAAVERLRMQVEVIHKNAPAGSTVRASSSSPGVRVSAVRTERAMDPATTPGGF